MARWDDEGKTGDGRPPALHIEARMPRQTQIPSGAQGAAHLQKISAFQQQMTKRDEEER